MGLEWGDIDNDYIHIRRAINAKGITTNGKNEFAARDFPQTRYTRMLLESQQVYRVTPLDPHERVFGSTGQLCYRKRWGIYCRYNGIPYITPYELRHTFSSIDAVTLSRKKAVPSPAAASTSQRRLPPRTGRASSSGICISLTLRWPNLKSTFMT